MQLSKKFQDDEFKCHCCNEIKIDPKLIDVLQMIRDITERPIKINSGYRCPTHNKKIGGSPKSQHLLGKAADIVIKGLSVKQMYQVLVPFHKKYFAGLGIYPEQGFIHIDTRDEPTIWVYIKSQGKYFSLHEFQALLFNDQDLKDQYEKIR